MPSAAPPGEFFVGYLRTPLRLVRFIAITLCIVFLLADAVALTLYRAQARHSSGDWGTAGEVSYDGVLVANPYPVVLVPALGRVAALAVLLVSDGKFGAPAGLAALDGKTVTVAGYPLLRDGLVVLQVSEETRIAKTSLALAPPVPLGPRTLTGEIVDSKCYLGAMIPGEGKVHQSCAGLCLLGDIPALFVTRDAKGDLTYRLLADDNGKAMAEQASSHAGLYLTLSGTITRLDGIELFSVPRASLD